MSIDVFPALTLATLETPLPLTQGGTGAITAANARTNLGLGSMAVQNAGAVAVTGGTMTNVAITTGTITNVAGITSTSNVEASQFVVTERAGMLTAFNGQLSAGTGRWNVYMPGTAVNHFGGNVGIKVAPLYPLDVTGDVRIAGHVGINTTPHASYDLDVNASARISILDVLTVAGVGWTRQANFELSTNRLYAAGVTQFASSIGLGAVPNAAVARCFLAYDKSAFHGIWMQQQVNDGGAYSPMVFLNVTGTAIGSISTSATSTGFNTSSDARLKHAIAPLTDSLAVLAALNPVSHRWNADDSYAENFLAHELQRVLPYAVTGEPDAMNPDGTIRPQQVDVSKLIPRMVGAIQELGARIAALETALGV